jgi:hypothetical protein
MLVKMPLSRDEAMFDRIARAPLLGFGFVAAAELLLYCATGARADDKIRAGISEPAALHRFLVAWFETLRFMKANKAETIRITQPWMKLPDDIASEIYDAQTPSFFTDRQEEARRHTAGTHRCSVNDKSAPEADFVDERFLPYAGG